MTLKMETLSYSRQIVTRVCHTFITYLLAARPGELLTLLTHYVSHHDAVANNAIQQCCCYTIKTWRYSSAGPQPEPRIRF